MSAPGPGIDDRDLHAWVDGRLDAEENERVGARIAADRSLSAQAAHLRRQNAALRAMLAPELEAPIPERLLTAARGRATAGSVPQSRAVASDGGPAAPGEASPRTAGRGGAANRPWFRQAAGIAVALLFGLVAGWTANERLGARASRPDSSAPAFAGEAGLIRAAAVAHAAYAPEVRHPVEVAATEQAHLVAWLSKRLGTALKVPDLSAQGWALVGGRLLPDASGGVAAQFMFDNPGGQRLTLFVRRDAGGTDTAFRYAQQDGIGSFYWIDRGFGYALSGEIPRDAMLSVATAVYRQINP